MDIQWIARLFWGHDISSVGLSLLYHCRHGYPLRRAAALEQDLVREGGRGEGRLVRGSNPVYYNTGIRVKLLVFWRESATEGAS